MSEASRAIAPNVGFSWKTLLHNEEPNEPSPGTVNFFYSRHGIKHISQDEAIAYFPHGTIRGPWRSNSDSQSDVACIKPTQITPNDISTVLKWSQIVKKLETWKSVSSYNTKTCIEDVAVLESVDEQETDTEVDAVSQWSPDRLASAIMQSDAKANMPRLREMIFVAENTNFSVEQSEQLSGWLLSFAEKHRNSEDPIDEAPVWSALRTGASMLRPDHVNCLSPLLDPGHSIETSLVTLKMIGRIFEAQPPVEVDEYQNLANEVYQIAESLVNPHAITASQTAAKAQLAIYALAAMASSRTEPIVESVQKLGVTWFTRRTSRKLRDLNNTWASRPTAVREAPRQLLDKVLQMLKSV